MKINNKLLVIGFCAVGFSANVLANGDQAYTSQQQQSKIKESGIYLEGNIGYGKLDENYIDTTKSDDTGFIYNFNAGYKFNKYLGIEAGYFGLPDEDFGHLTEYGLGNVEVKGNSNYLIDLALKGILPFDNGFSMFAKVGLGYGHHKVIYSYVDDLSVDNDAVVAVFGLGVGYNFTPHFGINIQGIATSERADSDSDDNGYDIMRFPATYQALVGLSYMF